MLTENKNNCKLSANKLKIKKPRKTKKSKKYLICFLQKGTLSPAFAVRGKA
jgi:hypothetical protein